MLQDYIKLGIGNLIHRRLRSWLTMIGIIIGIAAIVTLVSLGQGLQNFVVSQFSLAGTDVITVQAAGTGNGPPGAGVVNPLTQKDLNRIQSITGVKTAIGRIISPITITYDKKDVYSFAQSVPDTQAELRSLETTLNLQLESGRFLRTSDTYSVVLGNDFGTDKVFDRPLVVGQQIDIQQKPFTVVGILDKKGSFVLDGSVFLPDQTMRDITDTPADQYDVIAVKVIDVNDMSKIKADIERSLRKTRDVKEGAEDFTVQTPQEAISNLKSTLFAVQLFIYIIAGISLIVGGIGIMNTMYTAVLERTREIGIMKAIGASTRQVFAIFFIESGSLGMAGGLLGMLIGVGLASGLTAVATQFLDTQLVQASFSPFLLIGSLVFSFVIGSLAGFLPALQAAKMPPVKALSYAK